MNEWRLSGEAYGRIYNTNLTFFSKESISLSDDIIEEHMKIALRHTSDPEYRKLPEFQEQAKFQTEAGDEIIVSPRYVGSKLGSNDDGRGNTICAFYFNGEYVALAFYNESEKKIVAHEY